MDRSLRRELKPVFGSNRFWFDTVTYIDLVDLRIKSENEIIQIFFQKKIAPSSVRIFVLWLTLPSLFLVFIAIIFLKNVKQDQLVNLSKAAERFGKGENIGNLRPSGASEIRKATFEFDRMMKRINRHLTQRSQMSGISHDLRTPLTRLKLQLEMIDKKDAAKRMAKDIDEMERMLNDYLQYAKSQIQEKSDEIIFK